LRLSLDERQRTPQEGMIGKQSTIDGGQPLHKSKTSRWSHHALNEVCYPQAFVAPRVMLPRQRLAFTNTVSRSC
jgi:hypothetical protein